MRTVLSELHFLPCIEVFQYFKQADQIILEACENYQKGSYRNRCHLVNANGIQRLSLPLSKGKNKQHPIKQVELNYDESWLKPHWQSIRSAYGNSPFYFYYEDEIGVLFEQRHSTLWEFNMSFLHTTFKLLQWDKPILLSEDFVHTTDESTTDIRYLVSPKTFNKDMASFNGPVYPQVFQEKHGFIPNLSILDLLFCQGPQANLYLDQIKTPLP